MGNVVYRPGNYISLYPTWGLITVDDNANKARLLIPLNKIPNGVTSVSLTTGAGGTNYGFVIDSNSATHFISVAANQTVIGSINHQGAWFNVNLSSSSGTTYATGSIVISDGSLSFS